MIIRNSGYDCFKRYAHYCYLQIPQINAVLYQCRNNITGTPKIMPNSIYKELHKYKRAG